jgi:hypothetical protein
LTEYTLVTVAHVPDQPLLALQALSIARYLDEANSFVRSIVVIDTSDDKARIDEDFLRNRYGRFASRVRFVRAGQLGDVPRLPGWRRQQALKLMAAREVSSPRYIILDAKNHLVSPVSRNFFESEDGHAMRSYRHGFHHHPHRRYVDNVCRYFSIDPLAVDRFTPVITPYVVSTAVVRELLDYVECREAQSFANAFLGRQHHDRMTEFTLYGGYLIHTGRNASGLYDWSGRPSPVVWESDSTVEVLRALARAETMPFFSVHRRAFGNLDDDGRKAVARFWCSRGLFASEEAAGAFIATCADRFG